MAGSSCSAELRPVQQSAEQLPLFEGSNVYSSMVWCKVGLAPSGTSASVSALECMPSWDR